MAHGAMDSTYPFSQWLVENRLLCQSSRIYRQVYCLALPRWKSISGSEDDVGEGWVRLGRGGDVLLAASGKLPHSHSPALT